MASRTLLLQLTKTPSRLASAHHLRTPTHLPSRFRTPSIRHSSSAAAATPAPSALQAPDYLNPAERKVFSLIQETLAPSKLEVQDISGGCGSMYGIEIVSAQFAGLSVMKQHRLVNKVLGEEIKKWHGVQLKTKAP